MTAPTPPRPDIHRSIDLVDLANDRQFKGTPMHAELWAHIHAMRLLVAPKNIPNPDHGAPRPAGYYPQG